MQDSTVSIHETLKTMENLVEEKLVRHFGASNFTIELTEKIIHYEDIKKQPYLNQLECHLYLQQEALREFCKKRNIIVETVLLQDQVLNEVANECGKTHAEVELQFLYQLDDDIVIMAKSVTPERVKSNIQRTFHLSDQQMEKLKARNRSHK